MGELHAAARSALRWLGWCALLAISGCASFYVDGAVKEVAATEYKKPAPLRPVQLLFEFQTKGAANDRATALLKGRVADQVKASGLFESVSEAPVPGGALLSVTLNNVPLSDDAFSKGFVTGLTFGLAGSKVSDGYICTARYNAGTSGEAIVKQARHAVHTTLGAGATPGNATKADNLEAAVTTMTRQVLSNVLNDLSRDGAFK
jgi:hypothetical protein